MLLAGSMVRKINSRVISLRSSPRWGKLMSRYFTVITYQGRRSGRTFSTPVGYRKTGDHVTIKVMLPDSKTWWRNFTGDGGPISLDLDGMDRTGHAVARRVSKGRVAVAVRLSSPNDSGRSIAL